MPRRAAKQGISEDTFKITRGVDQRKIDRAGGTGNKLWVKEGDTIPIQFMGTPDEFIEFRTHSFQDGASWTYVPCLKTLGRDECPLCEEEDREVSKTSWRFACVIYNKKAKKVQVLEQGKEVGGRVLYQYNRSPDRFLRRVWDYHRFPGSPARYQLDRSDESPVKTATLETMDLDEYVKSAVEAYYGSLDSKDELEEPEEWDEDELEDEDTDEEELEDEDTDEEEDLDDLDEDEEDDLDDEDEEEDEEEEEEPPAPRRRAPAGKKKAATKKAPVRKKAAARKAPARRR